MSDSHHGIFGVFVASGSGTAAPEAAAPAPLIPRARLSVADYAAGVRACDRAVLGRAISLIESKSERHRLLAQELLSELMRDTGRSLRIGITGVPGVGKSSFIERLGVQLTSGGHRVAVLAVDPSSGVTGGSILGDKTRMSKLAVDANAFIRPSPSAGTLGGVAQRTRETLLLCEAAGFDVILVETVGVGQSETMVSEMTDFFFALMLPGAGDELQGIKRGLLELCDMIAVNKADGDNIPRAQLAAREYRNAVHCTTPRERDWTPPVVTCSAATGSGISELWSTIESRLATLSADGRLAARRQSQLLRWTRQLIDEELLRRFYADPQVTATLPTLEQRVLSGELSPALAARRALDEAPLPSRDSTK